MEDNSKFDNFISKLELWMSDNESVTEKNEEKFFGKYDIAILTSIGLLLTFIIVMVALRFVVPSAYWHFVDLFSITLLVTQTYFIVVRKLYLKK